jgi:hypothetical protein
VPAEYSENPELGTWVSTQRSARKTNRLPPESISRLDALGFEWDRFSAAWDERLTELQTFKDQHGHCNVPAVYSENPKLGSWVSVQRGTRRANNLSPDRISRLDALGFEWSRK